MEDAWLDLKQSGFRDLPMNRGWMASFRRWSTTPVPAPALADPPRRVPPGLRQVLRGRATARGCGSTPSPVDQLDAGFVAESMRSARRGVRARMARPAGAGRPGRRCRTELARLGRRRGSPISFLIQAPPGGGPVAASADKVACGIVFLTRVSPADAANEEPGLYDIFIWLRRAYRGLGIAGRSARKVLADFRECSPTA